jgi:hypothetical protein
MKIEFEYLNEKGECFLNSHWNGCCCNCKYRAMVNKHCSHSPRQANCVCSEPLGFYICSLFHAEYNCPHVYLSSEHGFCEMYYPKSLEDK